MDEIDFDRELIKVQLCMELNVDADKFDDAVKAIREMALATQASIEKIVAALKDVIRDALSSIAEAFAEWFIEPFSALTVSLNELEIKNKPTRFIPPKRPHLYVRCNQFSGRPLHKGRRGRR